MFGFMRRGDVECPVEPYFRDWILGRLGWLAEHLGDERLMEGAVVTPTGEHFPFGLDGTEETGRRMFEHVCGLMDVDPASLQLRFEDSAKPLTTGSLEYDWSSDGAAGTYEDHETQIITIASDALSDPMEFVATAAHELGHVILLGGGHLSGDEEDGEPLTDLLTVYYGMGIFGANASLSERQYEGAIGMSGWGYSRKGYLDFPMWGFAHAGYAFARGEANPPWAKRLRPDIRALFKQGLRYLEQTGGVFEEE
jgi:hypothetical protein